MLVENDHDQGLDCNQWDSVTPSDQVKCYRGSLHFTLALEKQVGAASIALDWSLVSIALLLIKWALDTWGIVFLTEIHRGQGCGPTRIYVGATQSPLEITPDSSLFRCNQKVLLVCAHNFWSCLGGVLRPGKTYKVGCAASLASKYVPNVTRNLDDDVEVISEQWFQHQWMLNAQIRRAHCTPKLFYMYFSAL